MSSEQNKAIVRRVFEDGINKADLGALREVISPTYVNHSMPAPAPGPEGFAQVVGMFQQAFPDFRVTIEGVNVVKRHRRQTQTTQGGIVEFSAPIHHSKAMLIDPKSGAPTRIRRRKDADGTLERIAVTSGQPILRNR